MSQQDETKFRASMQRLTEIKGRFRPQDVCDARRCSRADGLKSIALALKANLIRQDGAIWYAWIGAVVEGAGS